MAEGIPGNEDAFVTPQPTPEERLKQLEKEKRELRVKLIHDKEEKKRDKQLKIKHIEEINKLNQIGVNKILKAIYLYNKLSKNRRYEHDIFKEIFDLIKQNTEEDKEHGRINTESSA